ncbi:30S ribosomal protein 3, chloroplastic-like [Mercurialis annua]|uniref:30S ribosomal protein 3, chloroplastic-like n=1 Tax=Mercurialis annua TaxID=3986 RepID=UPI00215F531A|nr:30S ribosomal protein 3, chloroplastic-like [Mercurialis annua]
MFSITAIQSSISPALTFSPIPYQTPLSKPIKTSIFVNPKPNLLHSSRIINPESRNPRLPTFASAEALTVEEEAPEIEEPISEQIEVAVKQVEKPRLVLKFIWMEKNIGLALDQVIPGHGTIPLSPYFFWPRKDAWEELKTTLESKPWISQKKMIILLNQATDIINLWQQSGGNLTS